LNAVEEYQEKIFEEIKHINEFNEEFWYARELQGILEYKEWRNFKRVIDKAIQACENSQNSVLDHFVNVNKTIPMPKGATKDIEDIMLSRYACYLIVQNGDSKKKVVALGQTYFAVKTRQRELIDDYDSLSESKKRLAIRKEMIKHNKSLAQAASNAGVKTPLDYSIFQNHGYMGLYGGLRAKDIHEKKGLKKSQKILDHMGSTELAANLFRATQTDEKLRRENIKDKSVANQTHYEVGKTVRETIKALGGTMPEELPTPEKSIQTIKKELNDQKKLSKNQARPSHLKKESND